MAPKSTLPLQRLYGPVWSTAQWYPGLKCVWTLEKDQSNHHCPEPGCRGAIKTSCYRNLHLAFCCVLVQMPNGHFRFCGHRFQVESPKACVLHHWGPHDENRFFQYAKKGLPYELPPVFPHEEAGWEMLLAGYGSIQSEIAIRMGISRDRASFVRVLSYRKDGQPLEVSELVQVSEKEMLMGVGSPYSVVTATTDTDEDQIVERAQSPGRMYQRNGREDNYTKTYERYDVLKSNFRHTKAAAMQMQKVERAAVLDSPLAVKPGKQRAVERVKVHKPKKRH